MARWTDKDTAKYSGDSTSKVAAAEHQARDDATKEGLFSRGDSAKNSQPFSRVDKTGREAMSFFESIFGGLFGGKKDS